jgi:hypothetical protein
VKLRKTGCSFSWIEVIGSQKHEPQRWVVNVPPSVHLMSDRLLEWNLLYKLVSIHWYDFLSDFTPEQPNKMRWMTHSTILFS